MSGGTAGMECYLTQVRVEEGVAVANLIQQSVN